MLPIAKAIQMVNRLRDEGIISKYAIGGAVGALFYIEPAQTQDIDIFVLLEPEPSRALISLTPVLNRLKDLGYGHWEADKVVVENWPIQFLPATKPIEIDAIDHACKQPVADGVMAIVPPPEYLMGIALNLGRPKDLIRLKEFYLQEVYDPEKFKALVEAHGLASKWQRCLSLFKNDSPL